MGAISSFQSVQKTLQKLDKPKRFAIDRCLGVRCRPAKTLTVTVGPFHFLFGKSDLTGAFVKRHASFLCCLSSWLSDYSNTESAVQGALMLCSKPDSHELIWFPQNEGRVCFWNPLFKLRSHAR